MKSVTLYFKEGSSDKVYQAGIEFKDAGYVVNFAYGRRGSTLNTGTKTTNPVDEQTATEIFEKLIREKKAKGYTEGPDGTPYTSTDEIKEHSGIQPQLLNPIEEEEIQQYLPDPGWCMQEKFDGKRLLLQKLGNAVRGINRKGLFCGIPETIAKAAKKIPGHYLLDGEAVGESYFVFDLIELGTVSLRNEPYLERLKQLNGLLLHLNTSHLQFVTTAFNQPTKGMMLQQLKQENREGVVFKKLDAPYTPGRPASGGTQLKHKFYATASFVVAGTNKTKRSVRLVLFNEVYQKEAGNVTIPLNHPIPTIGEVVEVRFLYAFPESGCIYQAVYLGRRDDVSLKDCTTKQLKYKAPAEEDES